MSDQRISNAAYRESIVFALLSALSLATARLIGKSLTLMASLNVVVFIRFFSPLVVVLIIYLIWKKNKTEKLYVLVNGLRSLFTVASMYCLFFVLWKGNLLLASLLFSTSSLFLPFLGKIIFGSDIKLKTVAAIIISFIGVAVVIGPTSGFFSLSTLIGLLSGLFNACSQLFLHYTSKRQSPIVTNLITCACSSLISLIILIISLFFIPTHFSSLLSISIIPIITGLAVFSVINQIFRALAYRRVNKAASLAPFVSSTIVFSCLFDWLWLGIVPTWTTYLGITLVIGAAILMAIRKKS